MALPPTLVSTLQCTLPSQLGPMSAGIFVVVKASVLMLVLMSAIVIYSGSALSHSWPCWSVTPATLTLSIWGLWSAPTSTTSVHLWPHCQWLWQQPPCFFSVPFGFLVACRLPLFLQYSCQWPIQPHPEHKESLIGRRICLVHVILCSCYMHTEQYWQCGTPAAGAVVIGAVVSGSRWY